MARAATTSDSFNAVAEPRRHEILNNLALQERAVGDIAVGLSTSGNSPSLLRAFDEAGREVVGEVGELVITRPMPSMPLRFWGDEDGHRYLASYFEIGGRATVADDRNLARTALTGTVFDPETSSAVNSRATTSCHVDECPSKSRM